MKQETFIQRLGRRLAGIPAQSPDPQTRMVSGGTEKNPWARIGMLGTGDFKDPMRVVADRYKAITLWKEIYYKGGPVSECIDAYALFALTNGWKLQCEEGRETLKDRVQDWLDQPHIDLDSIMWQGIVDACICGTAFQEIITNKSAGFGNVWGIVPRDASSFWTKYDEFGRITGYDQITYDTGVTRIVTPLAPEVLMPLTLFPIPGEVYGVSLISRAYDDIMRDLDMIESITIAVHRHGTRKNQVRCGVTPDGSVSTPDLKEVRKAYEQVGPKNDWITGPDVEIKAVDDTLSNLQEYSNITLQRLATALGVPEEILGLGRGSTEATATVRHRAFMDKVSTIQEIVARTYSRKVIDRITGVPGAVWLEFNDPSPDDEAKKATWIAMLRQGMDPDAIVPAAWAREQFGIPPDEDEEIMADETRKPISVDQKTLPLDAGAPEQ